MNLNTEEHTVHRIIELMANILNYLSVSLYQ